MSKFLCCALVVGVAACGSGNDGGDSGADGTSGPSDSEGESTGSQNYDEDIANFLSDLSGRYSGVLRRTSNDGSAYSVPVGLAFDTGAGTLEVDVDGEVETLDVDYQGAILEGDYQFGPHWELDLTVPTQGFGQLQLIGTPIVDIDGNSVYDGTALVTLDIEGPWEGVHLDAYGEAVDLANDGDWMLFGEYTSGIKVVSFELSLTAA